MKMSGSPIGVSAFDDVAFDMISAVLYSYEGPLDSPQNPESSFQLILNPRARKPLPDIFFDNIETWHREKDEGSEEWKKC